ncbi:MAG TPA: hypothetical protein VJ385_04910 [Fibrobacteria bacterium]|nr:hypothetical protein [Fibrobacteria bacterium]
MNLFPADDRRLRELILHISRRCGDWDPFTPALLERMLFQADFLHFRLHGFPITGQTYRRGVRSPAPRTMARMVRDMARAGEFEISEEPIGDGLHVRRRAHAYREPELRIFDGQEIALVERVIRFYRRHWRTGSAGPDLLVLPWELAAPREEIPYPLALLGAVEEPDAKRMSRNRLPFETEQAQGMRELAHHALTSAS